MLFISVTRHSVIYILYENKKLDEADNDVLIFKKITMEVWSLEQLAAVLIYVK